MVNAAPPTPRNISARLHAIGEQNHVFHSRFNATVTSAASIDDAIIFENGGIKDLRGKIRMDSLKKKFFIYTKFIARKYEK